MKKRVTSKPSCQPHVEVQLPLPVLSRLRAVREGFFELCLRVGEQALDALMAYGAKKRPRLGRCWSSLPSSLRLCRLRCSSSSSRSLAG